MIKKILVSQPKPSSDKSPYYDIEKDLGVKMVFRPFFKVEGLSAKEFRQQNINLYSLHVMLLTITLSLPRKCVSLFLKI